MTGPRSSIVENLYVKRIGELEQHLRTCLALLKGLEWKTTRFVDGSYENYCMACYSPQMQGHVPNCNLDQEIRELKELLKEVEG